MNEEEFLFEVQKVISNVLSARTSNFLELTEQADLDPAEDFVGSDLREVNFGNANLVGFNFSDADLSNADLSRTNLREVSFCNANLYGANLRRADLRGADLSEANLNEADLSQACLKEANLKNSQALGANFSKAEFTGACLENWKIDDSTQLDEASCEYIFLKEGKEERYPLEGRFVSGEFPRLFHPKSLSSSVVNLKKWIDHDFAEAIRVGWQMIGVLLDPRQEQLAFVRESTTQFLKNGIQRTKLIDLGQYAVVLLVAVTPESEHKLSILIQAHPTRDELFVPTGLKLLLLADGELLQETRSRQQDNYIQLKRFICPEGQEFSISINFSDITVVENFSF